MWIGRSRCLRQTDIVTEFVALSCCVQARLSWKLKNPACDVSPSMGEVETHGRELKCQGRIGSSLDKANLNKRFDAARGSGSSTQNH